MATLRPRTSKNKVEAVYAWVASDAGQARLAELARQKAYFAFQSPDDLEQEIAVAVLEQAVTATDDIGEWAEQVAEQTAGRMRRDRLDCPATPTDTDILAEVVAEEECGEPEFETCAELVRFEKARAARIRRVLAKLKPKEREAVLDRYFRRGVVAEPSSTERMRFLRAKGRLLTLVTSDGYALSA